MSATGCIESHYLGFEVGLYHVQEWAAHNGVPVPHKEGRVNNSLLYKGMEEDTPTNILQVQTSLSWLHSDAAISHRLLRPVKETHHFLLQSRVAFLCSCAACEEVT